MGYLLLATIAAVGFFASITCHLMGWLGVEPPWGKSVFLLHIGWILLWFPLVTFANRTMPPPGRGNIEHLLAVLPRWAGILTYGLFIYALVNFGYFMFSTRHYPKHGVPFPIELRGFSGHWMLFYGFAAIGFVALARLARNRDRK